MKNKFLIILFILVPLLFMSCELDYSARKPTVYLLSWGNDYKSNENPLYITIDDYVDEYGERHADNYYGHNIHVNAKSLGKTVNDAKDVAEAFEAIAKKAKYNFRKYVLTGSENCNLDSYKMTVDQIKSEITDNDILICYFSGHGDVFECTLGEKYFLAFSDSLVNYEYVKKLIDSVSRGQKVIICDSCHSGALVSIDNGIVVNPDISTSDTLSILFETSVNQSGTLFVMTACTNTQQSYEGPANTRNGVFTTSLLKGLGWNSSSKTLGDIKAMKNNKITVAGLAKFIYSNDKNEDQNNAQIPVFSGRSDDIILFGF